MVKTKFKKAVSLMLAAVMSLTAFMGIGATTAFAAVGEKADVYLVDYPRSGDTNNNGEWGHGNLNYMNGWKGLSTKYTGPQRNISVMMTGQSVKSRRPRVICSTVQSIRLPLQPNE